MSKCNKCIHDAVCDREAMYGWAECSHYKNKDVVEVVRCKDCKHKVLTAYGEYNPEDIVCDYHMSDGFCDSDFCSFGVRKDGCE